MNLQETDMATRNEIFPSKYLKASDLAGKPLEVEIKDAPTETLGSGNDAETKTVLYFRNGVKPLPLNMTNWDAVATVGGGNTNDWPGHRVELYPTTTKLKTQIVDCIRIRPPREREQKPKASPGVPPADDDLDDDIPF
jgi:hypothetical protein